MDVNGGAYVETSKTTLAQFLDRWLKHIKPNVSPRTHERYEQIATKNIAPLLGGKILSKLQPIDISEAYAKLLESGRCDGQGGLSPRSVHPAHRVLYSALSQAERWKLIVRNPAALLERRDRPRKWNASRLRQSTPLPPLRFLTLPAKGGFSSRWC